MRQLFYLGAVCFMALTLSACGFFRADETAEPEERAEESAPVNQETNWLCDCVSEDNQLIKSVTGFGFSIPARKKALETCKNEHKGTAVANCKPSS